MSAKTASAHRVGVELDRGDDPEVGAGGQLAVIGAQLRASGLGVARVKQRVEVEKVLTPNEFPDLDTLQRQLLAFGRRYEQIAQPFHWKFTRADLDRLAQRLDRPAA